jgi:NTE family protein
VPGEALRDELTRIGQQVLALQGGGALGAYQAGVYQALHETGIEPDWVIGTSIGAINAAIIAGNAPHDRLPRLREFWARVSHRPMLGGVLPQQFANLMRAWDVVTTGIPAFFEPNTNAFLSPHNHLGEEAAAYYSVGPLRETLSDLVDFDIANAGDVRLTVGAANVRTSELRYFDTRDAKLDLRHILASGALPPAFPAVRVGEDLYWDGGILSNTPIEAVFDDNPRRNSIIYAVHIWNAVGPAPTTIWDVMNRQKDVLYSSRSTSHIKRQRQLHKLRHVISELASMIPDQRRCDPDVKALEAYGCQTRMHVVRLLAPALENEDHSKDLDFTASGIKARWEAGYSHTLRALEDGPWRNCTDPLEGFILHEAIGGSIS